jgi:transposase-like protein
MEGEHQMSRKRFSVEQIINHLREAEVLLAQGKTVGEICRQIGLSAQSYDRWCREQGGLKVDKSRRLKDLEQGNTRLKRAVDDLTLDKLILREAAAGIW